MKTRDGVNIMQPGFASLSRVNFAVPIAFGTSSANPAEGTEARTDAKRAEMAGMAGAEG